MPSVFRGAVRAPEGRLVQTAHWGLRAESCPVLTANGPLGPGRWFTALKPYDPRGACVFYEREIARKDQRADRHGPGPRPLSFVGDVPASTSRRLGAITMRLRTNFGFVLQEIIVDTQRITVRYMINILYASRACLVGMCGRRAGGTSQARGTGNHRFGAISSRMDSFWRARRATQHHQAPLAPTILAG